MEVLFVHLLKSSLILVLFLGSYHFFLKKETFFASNRIFLLSGLLFSIFIPYISIPKTVFVDPDVYTTLNDLEITEVTSVNTNPPLVFGWMHAMMAIYLAGVAYFSVRLMVQLWSIKKIKKESDIIADDHFFYVRTRNNISPFSFFRHIFYHPKQFTKTDLDTILAHEKVHAIGLHSIDILLSELIFIAFWFNPALWVYKNAIKQNLEFLADSKTCATTRDIKQYQYLMLQQAVGKHKITIANPFFNSIIKNRIVMLNQNQSKKISYLKFILILPALALFLVAFNTEEVVKFKEKKGATTTAIAKQPDFVSPLSHSSIKRISAAFGMTKDPISHEDMMHKGIDLVASRGTKVLSSADGIVSVASYNSKNGNYIVIDHNDDYRTKYFHLMDKTVTTGTKVKSGQIIGHVGNTGRSTGPHLHFETLKGDKLINPESLIPFKIKDKKESSKTKKTNAKKSGQSKNTAQNVKLLIHKDTTEDELQKMKDNLAKKGIDFSYTTVRNEKKEIINISMSVSGKGSNGNTFNGNYNTSSEEPIQPVALLYDSDTNSISFGNSKSKDVHISNDKGNGYTISIDNKNPNNIVKVYVNDSIPLYIIDGKESSQQVAQGLDTDKIESINVVKGEKAVLDYGNKGKNGAVIINLKQNVDSPLHVVGPINDPTPLYVVDGKELTILDVQKMDTDEIESIDVLKGEKAILAYGDKAKNGVVKIATKKKK